MKDIPISPRIEKMKRERRNRRLRLSILISVLLISIIGALAYFSSHQRVVINEIVISGNNIIDEEDIKVIVDRDLSGRYLRLFSRSNFLIYPHDFIYNDLILNFPRIENLDIKLEGVHKMRIEIKERAGSYLYCGISVPENKSEIGENCYFINNDGYIFDKAPYFSGDVYFKYYMNIDGNSYNPVKTQMLPKEKFQNFVRFVDDVEKLGLNPSYLVIGNDGVNYLYLRAYGDQINPKIIFKNEDDFDLVFSNLATAMNKPEFANDIKSKYSTLSYIDLRFKNKVLYKFE